MSLATAEGVEREPGVVPRLPVGDVDEGGDAVGDLLGAERLAERGPAAGLLDGPEVGGEEPPASSTAGWTPSSSRGGRAQANGSLPASSTTSGKVSSTGTAPAGVASRAKAAARTRCWRSASPGAPEGPAEGELAVERPRRLHPLGLAEHRDEGHRGQPGGFEHVREHTHGARAQRSDGREQHDVDPVLAEQGRSRRPAVEPDGRQAVVGLGAHEGEVAGRPPSRSSRPPPARPAGRGGRRRSGRP